jgi:transporter family-2 protein
MNASTLIVYALWSAVAGALIPVMASFNGTLGRTTGAPFHAAVIAVGVAFAVALATLLVSRAPTPSLEQLGAAPKFAYFGGIAMAFYALTVTFVTPKFGVGNVVICVVVAQLIMSSLIDQFGLFGAPVYAIYLKRAAGLGLLAVGAALVALR